MCLLRGHVTSIIFTIRSGFGALFLCALLGACTGTATAPLAALTPAPPASATSEISPQASLPAPPNRPPVSTATLRPSQAPAAATTRARATRTTAVDPRAALTEQARELRATQIARFPVRCDDFEQEGVSLAPRGNWLAIHCGYTHDQTLEVVSSEGNRWVLQFKDYLADKYIVNGNTPIGGLYPVHWTPDEEYLYFRSYIGRDGGGTCLFGFGDEGLYRLHLSTGAVSTTLRDGAHEYEIAFSPNGRWLAYRAAEMVLLDLISGDKLIVEAGGQALGNLTWSPDGTAVAYATCRQSEDGASIEESAVKVYALETRTSRTVIETEGAFLEIQAWGEGNLLEIVSTDWQTGESSRQTFAWSSEQLVTPTLRPR